MMQMIKSAMSCSRMMCIATVKAIFKLCITILKTFLVAFVFAAMIFGSISAVLVVGPQHSPSWMAPVWQKLNGMDPALLSGEALQLWEVRDAPVAISKWVSQMSPAADLLATAAGLTHEQWLRTGIGFSLQNMDSLVKSDPRVGKALCMAWMVSTFLALFFVLRFLIGTVKIVCRCVSWVFCAARNRNRAAHATAAEATVDTMTAEVIEPAIQVNIPEPAQLLALGENTSMNVSTMTESDEKKDKKKRIESPVVKVAKAKKKTAKEDVAPTVAKNLELTDLKEQKGTTRRRRAQY